MLVETVNLRHMKRRNNLRERDCDKHQQQYQRFELLLGTRTRLELEQARLTLSPSRYGRTFLFPTSKHIHRLPNKKKKSKINSRKKESISLSTTKWELWSCFVFYLLERWYALRRRREMLFSGKDLQRSVTASFSPPSPHCSEVFLYMDKVRAQIWFLESPL